MLCVQERSRSAWLREFSGRESQRRAGSGGGRGARVPQAVTGFDQAKELEACSAFGMTTCMLTFSQADEKGTYSSASLGDAT